MREQRQNIDFSEHKLTITKTDNILIHSFKKPGTIMCSIKFINTNGVMAVTGDFGNWIFCREFHPSAEGFVSDHYWLEKLSINSIQDGTQFSSELTKKEIEEGINGGLEEYGYSDEKLDKMLEYYKELLDYVDYSEWEYTAFAYGELPDFIDAEEVPMVKETMPRLEIVFDAFDIICERLKKENGK